MNCINLVGRLVRDVEMRYSPSGVCISTFTLAVDRKFKNSEGQKEADFIQIKCFKALGELVANYLSKGKLAGVTGSLQISSYNDKDGNKKYSTDVIANDVQFLSPKDNSSETPNSPENPKGSFGHEVNLDDDIPF